jgi:hypothetical protein
MRYLTGFKFFESRDSDISELINDEIAPVVNDILLELNFKNIEGECRFVTVNNRTVPNSYFIIIKLKKECSNIKILNRDEKEYNLTWDEVSDVIGIASDYLKDHKFIYSAEKTNYWGTGVTFDPSKPRFHIDSLKDCNPGSRYSIGEYRMEIYFEYKENIS